VYLREFQHLLESSPSHRWDLLVKDLLGAPITH
jgi:hypothetical protein